MITKKFMMSFLPYNYEGIEKVLSEKSSQGWQLVKAGARIQIVQVKMRIPYYKFYGTM